MPRSRVILADDLRDADDHAKGVMSCTLKSRLHLKEIGHEMDLDFPLTSKVSRHTYATALKRAGKPIGLIQDAMAHSSQKTTGIYLDSLGNESIDRANEEIFKF